MNGNSNSITLPQFTQPASPSSTPPSNNPIIHQSPFSRLARLSPVEYDRERIKEARLLRIRVETLDDEIARARARFHRDHSFNSSLSTLHSPLRWPEPVDGADLLHQVAARFARHIVLSPGAAHALSLWVAHTHCFRAFLHTPRLNLYSPDRLRLRKTS